MSNKMNVHRCAKTFLKNIFKYLSFVKAIENQENNFI